MRATIYGVKPSPPTHSARLMAEHKGIDHKMVWLVPGIHPVMIHARGFRGSTVPAMKLGRKRYQRSPRERLEVEEAERWGEEILQEAPRRIFADRDSSKWALKLMPEYPGTVPAYLPQEWLEPLGA